MSNRPVSKVHDALYRVTGYQPKRSGREWRGKCPAHRDRTPSLSISEGDDGRALLHCHAGCKTEDVLTALSLTMADLMPPADVPPRSRNRPQADDKGKTYPTARDAVAALDEVMQRKHKARQAGCWSYLDVQRNSVAVVIRYDLPTSEGEKQQKTFRPISQHQGGWRCSDPPEKWPLYRLPELPDADRIYVVEGEKAVDAARSIGLFATTSAHGAQCPQKTDWTSAAGKEVVILPDNDQPGRGYQHKIIAQLAGLTPVPTAKVVDLLGLPLGGDIVDFIEAQHAAGLDHAAIRAKIEVLADAAPSIRIRANP